MTDELNESIAGDFEQTPSSVFELLELPELPQITEGEYGLRVTGGMVIIKVRFIPDVKP